MPRSSAGRAPSLFIDCLSIIVIGFPEYPYRRSCYITDRYAAARKWPVACAALSSRHVITDSDVSKERRITTGWGLRSNLIQKRGTRVKKQFEVL
jgi:hypothetical protein